MKCILHVGLHKTGTTSIQDFCYQNRSLLLDNDINYIYLYRNNSNPLFSLYCKDPLSYGANKRRGIRTNREIENYNLYIEKLFQNKLLNNRSNNVLISGEDISFLDYDGLRSLKDQIAPYFDLISIIIYVRPPVSTLCSKISHFVSNVGRSLDQMLDIVNNNPEKHVFYQDAIEKFFEVFGYDNVTVRPYDKSSLCKGDIISDFTDTLGLKKEVDKLQKHSHENTSFSYEALKIFSRINKKMPLFLNGEFNFERGKLQYGLRILLGAIGGSKLYLSSETRNKVKDICYQDIYWLYKHTHIDFFLESCSNKHADSAVSQCVEDSELLAFSDKLLQLILDNQFPDDNFQNDIINLFIQINQIDKNEITAAFYIGLGELLLAKSYNEAANGNFQQALLIDPDNPLPYLRLSQIYAKSGYNDDAVNKILCAINLNKNNSNYYQHLSNLYMRKGQLEDAESTLDKAVRLDPESSALHFKLSQVHTRNNNIDSAITEIYRAIELNNGNYKFYHHLGNLFKKKGDLDRAEVNIQEAVKLEPENQKLQRDFNKIMELKKG